jgi:polysaccharide deacetylase 2 family uncharacterized protein YibQ
MIRGSFLLTVAATLLTTQSIAEPLPRIAIIIDDLGYQLEAGRRAIDLPGPVAFAVLPGTPQGRQLARIANEHGKEVLLHLPLEAVDYHGPAMQPLVPRLPTRLPRYHLPAVSVATAAAC